MIWTVGSRVGVRRGLLLVRLLALASATSSAAAQPCVVRGQEVSLEHVTVHPANGEALELSIAGVPVSVAIPARAGSPARLEVSGTIAFKATAKNVWYTITTALETAHGQVQLRPGAQIVGARSERDQVSGSVVMYADDVMEGEDKEPDESIGPVLVPCASLTLDAGSPEDEPDGKEVESRDDARWWETKPGKSRIRLRAEPRATAPAVTWSSHCDGEECLQVEELERRGDWIRGRATGEHATVTGWARRAELQVVPEEHAAMGRSYGCSGDHGPGGWGHGYAGKPEDHYEGPARVKAGTKIFADQGTSSWATVTQEATFQVGYFHGQQWAMLWTIPGIAGPPPSAYVPVSALILPPGTKP